NYTNSGLSIGNTYYYRVRAGNAVGNSDYSNIASAALLNLPASPSNLTATAVSLSAIALAWTDNANNETAFQIERSTDGASFGLVATLGADTTAFSDSGLSAGTRYYYRARAKNNGGSSAYSNVASAIARGVATHFSISTPGSSTAGSAQNVT